MIITQLIKKNNKMIVVFDTGLEIRIHYDVFIRNGLRRGDDISAQVVSQLSGQSDLLYAKESALRILGRRTHSIRELKRKLLQKKYQNEMIEQVIADLCASGYLDDEAFTKQYTHEKIMRKDGIQKIKNELMIKGVSKEIINQVLAEVDHDQERENAKKLAEKKALQLKSRGTEEKKLKQKIYAFLISKGYDFDLVRDIIEEIL